MSRHAATRSPVQQAFALHARFPEVRADIKRGRLIWTGAIQPTPLSRTYRVQITYMAGRVPVVRVQEPVLEGRPDEPLPHVYGDGTLCLHLAGEWTPEMLIVDTTLPWTAEWLINYEIWQATGGWHGGGEWPLSRGPDAAVQSDTSAGGKSTAGAVSQPT